MGFFSALKKFGQLVVGADQKVPQYSELAQTIALLTPGDGDDKAIAKATAIVQDGLVRFQNIILDAEVAGQALGVPGADKAKMAAPALMQLFLDLPFLKGKKPKNPDSAKVKAAALGSALADWFNEFEG